MLTTKYNKANHTEDDDMEIVCMEDVMKSCKIAVGKHGAEDNTDLRVLKETGCERTNRIQRLWVRFSE